MADFLIVRDPHALFDLFRHWFNTGISVAIAVFAETSQSWAAHLFETHYLHTLSPLLGCWEANTWAYSAEGVLKQHNTPLCAEVGVWCRCSWSLVLLCLECSQVFNMWGSRFVPSTLYRNIGVNQASWGHGLMKPLACDDEEGALLMAFVCFWLGNWKCVAATAGAMFSG